MAEATAAGTLSPAAMQELEAQLAADAAFAQAYQENLSLIQSMEANGRHRRFKNVLKEIRQEQTAPSKKTRIISLKPQHVRTAAMAAGVALFTSLATIWAMQHNTPKVDSKLEFLRRKVDNIEASQRTTRDKVQNIENQQAEPAQMPESNLAGSGFALTNDGYIVTNFHVTDDADSIYIQTRNGHYYKAHVFATNPKSDLAILKIEDKSFRFAKGELPYTLEPSKVALGSKVFTLGFPQNEIVYNQGYISSRNGYQGDSMQYRLEIAASPGQSGSPVVDDEGNIVGILNSKATETESTTYAISSKALLRLIHDLPKDANIRMAKANRLSNYSHEEQIEKLQDYTCMIQVYKK